MHNHTPVHTHASSNTSYPTIIPLTKHTHSCHWHKGTVKIKSPRSKHGYIPYHEDNECRRKRRRRCVREEKRKKVKMIHGDMLSVFISRREVLKGEKPQIIHICSWKSRKYLLELLKSNTAPPVTADESEKTAPVNTSRGQRRFEFVTAAVSEAWRWLV